MLFNRIEITPKIVEQIVRFPPDYYQVEECYVSKKNLSPSHNTYRLLSNAVDLYSAFVKDFADEPSDFDDIEVIYLWGCYFDDSQIRMGTDAVTHADLRAPILIRELNCKP